MLFFCLLKFYYQIEDIFQVWNLFFWKESNNWKKKELNLINIGLISREQNIITSFKQFSKFNKELNISYFNDEKEINDDRNFYGIVEIKNINNTYEFIIKQHKKIDSKIFLINSLKIIW